MNYALQKKNKILLSKLIPLEKQEIIEKRIIKRKYRRERTSQIFEKGGQFFNFGE